MFLQILFNFEVNPSMSAKRIPNWLIIWVWNSLLGEIYPAIRAIAVSFSDKKELIIRYYLNREPSECDFENIEVVITNILANTSSASEITKVQAECLFSKEPLNKLDPLDGFVYAKREQGDNE